MDENDFDEVELHIRLKNEKTKVSISEKGSKKRVPNSNEICKLETSVLKMGANSVKILDKQYVKIKDEQYINQNRDKYRYLKYKVI